MGAHWRARKGLRGALAAGAIAALIGGFISRSAFGLPLSVLGVAFAVAGGAAFGIERIPGGITEAVSPAAVLARDRRAALLLTLITGAAAAVLTGVAVASWDASYQSPDTGHLIALEDGLSMAAGTGVTVTVGLAFAGLGLAWPQWLIARSWLALRGHLPFRLMAFLDDAHERGVLRQAGPFYQFRHIELQHHLGARSRRGESGTVAACPETCWSGQAAWDGIARSPGRVLRVTAGLRRLQIFWFYARSCRLSSGECPDGRALDVAAF
jgi:hypothetical protein